MKMPENMNVYDRLAYKIKNEIYDFDVEEREVYEDLIKDSFCSRVERVEDELLVTIGIEEGIDLNF